MRPTNVIHNSTAQSFTLRAVEPNCERSTAARICRALPRNAPVAAIRSAQAIWDAYFAKMLPTFHEPNPDLNRDLALDRTVRALGQRPMTAGELARSGLAFSCLPHTRSTQYVSERDLNFERKLNHEHAFEELCTAAAHA